MSLCLRVIVRHFNPSLIFEDKSVYLVRSMWVVKYNELIIIVKSSMIQVAEEIACFWIKLIQYQM